MFKLHFAVGMGNLFGTDGIRGRAGEFPLDGETVKRIGASLARHFRERLGREPRFVSGRDTRESGERIERAVTSGIVSEGGKCTSAEVITTPGIAYLTNALDVDAGIVISASHNPYQDNGVKVFLPSGRKLDEGMEAVIEKDIATAPAAGSIPDVPLANGDTTRYRMAYSLHLSRFAHEIEPNKIKIVIDCANGAASGFARKLFKRCGGGVVVINNKPDGQNINERCGSLHLEGLQSEVLDQKADFGVAFDGDADRALFVNENGEVVDGDATLWIMAKAMRSRGELRDDRVVATVMSNIGLELALRSIGVELVRTPVGDKYVLDELLRSGAAIGGEQSGHIIFPRISLVGDGMMTALLVLQILARSGRSFSALTEGFIRYPQVLVNVNVREKPPFESIPAISDAASRLEKELDGNGRLLLRYSGTEDVARVMIEGKDQAHINEQAASMAEIIRREIG